MTDSLTLRRPVAPSEDVTLGQLLLVEYDRVKDEQKARIGFRDNLLYATIAAMAAVIAAALQTKGHARNLLLLPPVALVLGWTYLVNDEKISAIGRYIRDELAPRLSQLVGEQSSPIFGWERVHRGDSRRLSRKYLQLAVDLGTFCLSPLAAVVVYWSAGPITVPLLLVSATEVVAAGVLAWQIVRYADV